MFKRSNLLGACLCALVALVLLATGCSKKNSPPAYSGPPTITGINATTFHAGDTVHVSGKGLTATTYTIQLFDSLNINVLQVTDTSIIFVLPAATHFSFYGAASGNLIVENATANQEWTITIDVPEPHGWFDQAQLYSLRAIFAPQQSIHIYFPSDSIGYLQHNDGIMRTTNGGDTWQVPGSPAYGGPFGLAILDTNNVFAYGVSLVAPTTNGGNSWGTEPLPSALYNSVLTGMSMFGPATGVIMNQPGDIYSLAGSWDTTSPTGLIKEYQTNSPVILTGFGTLSAVDLGDLMAGGTYYTTTAYSDVIVKTNGVYDEYTLPPSVSNSGFLTVQLLNPTLGFALDGSHHILKYTGNRNWSALSQTATALLFLDMNNGYSSSAGAVYQTSNGGASWSSVFNLQPNQVLYNFAAHNGHIWGIGMDTTAGKGFIIKYNP